MRAVATHVSKYTPVGHASEQLAVSSDKRLRSGAVVNEPLQACLDALDEHFGDLEYAIVNVNVTPIPSGITTYVHVSVIAEASVPMEKEKKRLGILSGLK